MGNIRLLSPALSDASSYSGGSWSASLPLANLKDQQPKKVARSSDATNASTQFKIDLGYNAAVQMFALINHNIGGTVRIRASVNSDGSSPLIDHTLHMTTPNVVWGSLAWGVFPWEGYNGPGIPGGAALFYDYGSTVFARYILVNIDDTANADGYVQAGRFIANVPFVPAANYSPGAGLGYIDESRQTRAVGGALYSDKRPKRRSFSATLDWLTEAEAIGAIYTLQHDLGITDGLLVIVDPDDAIGTLEARTIYGHLTSLEKINTARAGMDAPYSWSLSLEELI